MRPLVVVGDTLLDRDVEGVVERVCPDAPAPVLDQRSASERPGGAGLAALLARHDGRRPVVLVTAIGADPAGATLERLLTRAGIEVVALPQEGATAEKVRLRAGGQTLLRLDRGGSDSRVDAPHARAREVIAGAAAVLVTDYGNGVCAQPGVRKALAGVAGQRPLVWDPHPRGAVPVPGARLVTPNRKEAEGFAGGLGAGLDTDVDRARHLRAQWSAQGVAITLGKDGALLVDAGGTPLRVPAHLATTHEADPCGAGDRFAARAAGALADGGLLSDAVVAAVRAAANFVAAGGASAAAVHTLPGDGGAEPPARETPAASLLGDALSVAERARSTGGTVVATGGCFDLLHAGHVQLLEAARRLGDCLVVCLNSDASVRERKGPGRPLVSAADRAAVLRGLRCVDAVAVFDEDTPDALLQRLRPAIWAKGADYTIADLPEAETVAAWGGETVVLPYLDGRSTTRLLEEAARHGG